MFCVFAWVLGIKLRSLCLHIKHFSDCTEKGVSPRSSREVSVWGLLTAASQVQERCQGRWTGQARQAHPVEALLPLAAPCRHSQSCPLPCC